jgi:hypothetical protein
MMEEPSVIPGTSVYRMAIHDRRRERRVKRATLLAWVNDNDVMQICPVLDIGRSGLQLHWATTVPIGTEFPVRLVHQETGRAAEVTAQLVWTQSGPPPRSGFRVDEQTEEWNAFMEIFDAQIQSETP